MVCEHRHPKRAANTLSKLRFPQSLTTQKEKTYENTYCFNLQPCAHVSGPLRGAGKKERAEKRTAARASRTAESRQGTWHSQTDNSRQTNRGQTAQGQSNTGCQGKGGNQA